MLSNEDFNTFDDTIKTLIGFAEDNLDAFEEGFDEEEEDEDEDEEEEEE